jgi:hypothetical protein
MKTIKEILMHRDSISAEEADEIIAIAKEDLAERLEAGEMPFDICEEHFGLEPDYIDELMEGMI